MPHPSNSKDDDVDSDDSDVCGAHRLNERQQQLQRRQQPAPPSVSGTIQTSTPVGVSLLPNGDMIDAKNTSKSIESALVATTAVDTDAKASRTKTNSRQPVVPTSTKVLPARQNESLLQQQQIRNVNTNNNTSGQESLSLQQTSRHASVADFSPRYEESGRLTTTRSVQKESRSVDSVVGAVPIGGLHYNTRHTFDDDSVLSDEEELDQLLEEELPVQALVTTAEVVHPNEYVTNGNTDGGDIEDERTRAIEAARAAFMAEAVEVEAVVSSPLEEEDGQKQKSRVVLLRSIAVILSAIVVLVGLVVGLTVQRSNNNNNQSSNTAPVAVSTTMTASASPTPVLVVFNANGLRVFITTIQLQDAADVYEDLLRRGESPEHSDVAREYGYPIGTWDVSRITDFSRIFDPDRSQLLDVGRKPNASPYFDENLSGWDVSKATSMYGMFAAATSFTGRGLDVWNVTQVIDFSCMFSHAQKFNGNISNWNTSRATTMKEMFFHASLFDADLSKWDVSKVRSMQSMFQEAIIYRGGDLTKWNVGEVESMDNMFYIARAFDGNVSTWNTSKVTIMRAMFGYSNFGGDLSLWSVDSVQNMKGMFLSAKSFPGGDLTGWKTSRVADMSFMFYEASSFAGNVSTWDVSNVLDFDTMFRECSMFDADLSHWDTSKVKDMSNMFHLARSFSGNISRWNTSKVSDMAFMFNFAESFNGDLSAWDVRNVQSTEGMFDTATGFNQSLCSWRDQLSNNAGLVVNDMFKNSGCAIKEDPVVSNWSQSPMCTDCPTTQL